jgi:hypothetical protein
MKARKLILPACLFISVFIIFFFSTAISQVKIKERVEIKPSDSLNGRLISSASTLNTTLPPLDMNNFALYCSDFWEYFNDIYEDEIFVPRIGGTMDISLYQHPLK